MQSNLHLMEMIYYQEKINLNFIEQVVARLKRVFFSIYD
ncbi:hypothetical protein C8N37_101405 [Sphingobacterium faecium]|nr:hypothetical protein C8N37_101405 [Sphingobacterium faecium]